MRTVLSTVLKSHFMLILLRIYWTLPFSDVIILGDTNFDINDANAGYLLLKPLLLNYNIVHCDDFINGPIQCTYDNTALVQSFRIDHFFVTPYVRACTSQVLIIDSGANTSDHMPAVLRLQLLPAASSTGSGAINKPVSHKVRWHKGNLTEYYRLSGEALAALNLGCSCSSCDVDCISYSHFQYINDYYNKIVTALKGAEKLSIHSIGDAARLKSLQYNEVCVVCLLPGGRVCNITRNVCSWHGARWKSLQYNWECV